MRQAKRFRGYVLVESMISAAVVSSVLAGAVNVLASARANTALMARKGMAQLVLNRVVEELRVGRYGGNLCERLPADLRSSNCMRNVSWGPPTVWMDASKLDSAFSAYNIKVKIQTRTAPGTCNVRNNSQAGTTAQAVSLGNTAATRGSENVNCFKYPDIRTAPANVNMNMSVPHQVVEARVTYMMDGGRWAVPLSAILKKVNG